MKKFIICFLLLPLLVMAQVTVQKPLVCDEPERLIDAISNGQYQEKLSWSGNGEVNNFVLMVNEKTKTWTILEFNGKIACILGTGIDHQRIFLGPKI